MVGMGFTSIVSGPVPNLPINPNSLNPLYIKSFGVVCLVGNEDIALLKHKDLTVLKACRAFTAHIVTAL